MSERAEQERNCSDMLVQWCQSTLFEKIFLMQFDEVNALWIWTLEKLRFVECSTHKSMMINHEEECTEVSSEVFKLSDIARLEEEIETWDCTTSSQQKIAVIWMLRDRSDWFTINHFKQKLMNHNSNRLCDRVIDHLHSSESYREENCPLHTWENFYKLWSIVGDSVE